LANPLQPITFLGYLAEAADRRRKNGIAPFTVMSCDNVQGNGDTARKALLAFAGMRDTQLEKWIEENIEFPNSMVDRITPVTTDADKAFIAEHFGVLDLSPVVPEPFHQWVIEDSFCNGRPAWEKAGAQLTTDVTPFERVKMRLLNGGHSTIAYIAALLGIDHVYEAMADEQICALEVMFLEEVTPVLPDLPGMELTGYKASLIQRFSNPSLPDQIMRIASEGTAKLAKFIVPTIGDLREIGKKPQIIPLVIAAWLYAMCGTDEAGRPIAIVDASASLLNAFVMDGGKDARLGLSINSVFGDLLTTDAACAARVQQYLDSLRGNGVRATLQQVIANK
jgi:mannitol 2-dehydrogenase